jgi:hypothetical protein
VGAMGAAIWAVTARDARGFFEHCGYGLCGFNRYYVRCRSEGGARLLAFSTPWLDHPPLCNKKRCFCGPEHSTQ